MLVLTRKVNEEIIIKRNDDADLAIKLISMKNGQVKLGFAGPDSYRIIRKELENGEESRTERA